MAILARSGSWREEVAPMGPGQGPNWGFWPDLSKIAKNGYFDQIWIWSNLVKFGDFWDTAKFDRIWSV